MIGHHFVDLGLVVGGKRRRRLLVARHDVVADVGQPLLDARIRASACITAALSFATISFGVPLGAHMPCQ